MEATQNEALPAWCEPQIRKIIRGRLARTEYQDLDDAVQFALLRLIRRGPAYWTPQGVSMIAVQSLYNWRDGRSWLRYQHVQVDDMQYLTCGTTGNTESLLSVRAAIERLPAEQRRMLEMRMLGCTWAEVRRKTQWSAWRVRTIYHLALANLRTMCGVGGLAQSEG